jgi:hypothetical protein
MTTEQKAKLAGDLAWASDRIAAMYREIATQLRQQARKRGAAARRIARAAR